MDNGVSTVLEALPDESLNIKALQDRALELWAVDQASALELGRALLAVREALREQHGAFAEWFRENGLEENRVYYCLRRAEGKVSPPPPKPGPPIALTNRNTCIAKYAPKVTGKFTTAAVCVNANGTTVTDGITLFRVSLPPHTNAPATAGLVPPQLVAQMAGEQECELTFCGQNVSATILGQTSTVRAMEVGYPPTDDLIARYAPVDNPIPQHGVRFAVRVEFLLKLASALSDFNRASHATALISVYPNMLRADAQDQQQTMVGLMMTSMCHEGRVLEEARDLPPGQKLDETKAELETTKCSDEPKKEQM